jgi:hypothetical protein
VGLLDRLLEMGIFFISTVITQIKGDEEETICN